MNGSKFANSDLSKSIAEDFLRASSTEQVNKILGGQPEFRDEGNWRPYGQAEKNWDRVNVQTTDPVGALAELIINSIDAILMRRAKEDDIDSQSNDAPQSMSEAVKRFFPEVHEGKLTLISQEQRTNLAEKSVLIGIQRKTKRDTCPNYTIVDFGEGQNHDKFEKTFLSLGEKNKEGIPFVQGRFNMGSTGSITFCTRADIRSGMYKFVLSKRNLNDSDGLWGWTLIRVREIRKGEVLPVAEYFFPNGEMAFFQSTEIRPFNDRSDIGVIKNGGSIVKLYEYDIGPRARGVDFGLYDALTTNLIDCALPVRLYDFDAKRTKFGLRSEGIAPRTFSGLKTILESDDEKSVHTENEESKTSIVEHKGVIVNNENSSLGTINICWFALEKMKDYLGGYEYRIFYTVNGQVQAKERASFLRRAKLDDLRNHLIVQIDCNHMNSTARSVVFKPDRERMAEIELTRELRKVVIDELQQDGALREYAREIRSRSITDRIEKESDKEFLFDLVKNNPDLQELFDVGSMTMEEVQKSGGNEKYKGMMFPTHLTPINLDESNVKMVPINSHRRIECKTDVQNDYLIREANQGRFVFPTPAVLPNSGRLRNGKFRIQVRPPANAKEGDQIFVTFGFEDSNPNRTNPLTFDALIKITAAEEKPTRPGGGTTDVKTKKDLSRDFPDIRWLEKSQWSERDFNEESGAYVSSDEKLTVYVNRDNKYLLFLISKERDDARRELILHQFKYSVGLLTLAMYKKLVREQDEKGNSVTREEFDGDIALQLASSAVAAHVVTLINKLGGGK